MTRMPQKMIALLAIIVSTGITALGQSKGPVPVSEFGKWETFAMQPRGGLSPDGRWIAYGVNRSNRDNELRIVKVADGTAKTIPYGSQASFSADSQYVAYAIGHPEAEEEKLRQQRKPIHRKLGILSLTDGNDTRIEGIETFAFSDNGKHLLMKRDAPERTAPGGQSRDEANAPAEDVGAVGTTVIVRHLATGRDTTFGNVSEFAWQDNGTLLALVISAEDKMGNGLQLFDADSGVLRVLDSSPSVYAGLSWREDSDDLAALRASTVEQFEGPTHAVLAWRGLARAPQAYKYDPQSAKDFPAGMRLVSYRRPSWSEDGRILFVGVARWDENLAAARKAKTDNGDTTEPAEEPATVEVWHARDVDVMPRQKVNARADRERNLLSAWHLDAGRFVQLQKSFTERVTPLTKGRSAFVIDWTRYAMPRTMGRGAADLSLIDLGTGIRTKLRERINEVYVRASPEGRYLLFFEDDHYWTIDTTTRAAVNITRAAAASFVDRESDATLPQKPPFGVAGWTKNDEAVILYDKFDLWRAPSAGAAAVRLTNGAAEQVRHRYLRLDPEEEAIDTSKPLHVSLFNMWTKASGYARLDPGAKTAQRLVYLDKSVAGLARAKDADVFAYAVQAFDDPPDLMIGGPSLNDAKPIASLNPFFRDYAWGRAELVEYKTQRGDRLQGALFYPAGYEPGKKYPMVVYMYERLSDNLHRWSSPSPREPYNAAVFTSQGYFYFQPDILFRPREPGVSAVECVGAAVTKVVGMGMVDPARIGIVGHSWGGFDTVYLSTHTKMFAAGVAGAPITNLVSNYGNHHWSAGIAETDHIETGQQRMEVPLWEDLQAYIRNSAVFGVHTMTTPLLVAFGDNDGTVHWHQGVELYNIARRAGKDVVMLVYAGEDHSLRKKPNQLDYQRRILQWFGHYLRSEPAPSWIAEGFSHLDRERELKRLKKKKGT